MIYIYRRAPFLMFEAFWGFTYLEVLLAALALIVVWVVGDKLFSLRSRDNHVRVVQCSCGWGGSMGRYVKRCPACGAKV